MARQVIKFRGATDLRRSPPAALQRHTIATRSAPLQATRRWDAAQRARAAVVVVSRVRSGGSISTLPLDSLLSNRKLLAFFFLPAPLSLPVGCVRTGMSLHAARRVVVWTSAQVVAGVRQRAAVGGLYGAHVQHPAAAAVLWRSRRGALPSMRSCHTLVGEGADTTEGNAVEETPDLKALTPSQVRCGLLRVCLAVM